MLIAVYTSLGAVYLHHLLQKSGVECGLTCIGDDSASILYQHIYPIIFFAIHLFTMVCRVPNELLSYQAERLLLTQTAIQYIPPKKLFFSNKMKIGWQVQLSTITGCTVQRDAMYQLYVVIATDGSEKSVRYSLWKDPQETTKKRIFKLSLKCNPDDDLNFPVITYLKQSLGEQFVIVDIDYEQEDVFDGFNKKYTFKHDKSFDLQSNPLTNKLTNLLFIIVIYSAFDLVFNNYTYAGAAPVAAFFMIGSAIFILVLLMQLGKKIPANVAVILAILIGVASGFASYPAVLRISSIAAEKSVESYAYRIQHADESSGSPYFIPVDATLPVIELRANYDDYWSQFETGSTHVFNLQRGILGLWLLDTDPIRQKALEYRHSS